MVSLLLILALVISVALVATRAGHSVMSELDFHLTPGNEPLLHRMIMMAIALYIVLMALPFCPGIEIALGMMMLLGPPIVPLVYLATVAALLLAFLVGRLVPAGIIIEAFDVLRLHRARDLLVRMASLDGAQRMELLRGPATARWLRALLSYRYVAVAVALNTPGNIVIGDGGGIAMAAGFSRLFSFPAFAVTVVLAVAPVPIAILVTEWWLR